MFGKSLKLIAAMTPLFIVSAWLSQSVQAATATFGYTSIGSMQDTGDANYINAWRFRTTSTQSGTIVSMSVYISGPVSAAPNNQFQVAMYADASGVPGALIASSASKTITPNAWNTVTLSGSLLPNTSYWLAYNTNSVSASDNNVPVGAGSSGQQVWRAQTFGSWPTTFGAIQGSSSNQGSIYVTYTPGTGVADTTPPTVPANLQASAVSTTQINLSWSASTDNVAVTGYRLERCQGASCTNFAQIATPTATSFNDTGLVANTAYSYRVRATDAAGNLSNYSSVASATTLNTSSQTSGSACNAPPLPLTGTRIVNVSLESQLQSAVANAQTGDTIVLADGTYYLTSTLYLNGKNNVTIRGNAGCDGVILVGKGMDNANYGNVLFGIWSNSLNTTIAHLTIRDTYDNTIIFNGGAQAPHVYSVKLLNAGSQFIKANPTDPANGIGVDNGVVEYSWMEYTAGPPATNHGAGVGYTNGISAHTADNWIIRNNVFKNFHTPDSAAYLWNPAVLMWNHSQNTITEKNIFINVDRAIAYGLVNQSSGTDHSGGTIRNNFVYLQPGLMSASRTAGSDGAIIVWDSPNSKVYHNTILTNGNVVKAIEFRFVTTGGEARNNLADAPLGSRDGATFAQSGNYLSATPAMFVSPTSADLHLLDTTATRANVIDHGVVLTAVADDIDGNTRPAGAGYDIGADEFISSQQQATDTTPPSVPQGLSATVVSSSQINLAWSASTDNVGVTGYHVYRSGTQIATVTSTSYAVTGLSPSTPYSFTVAAYDAAGNVSAQSAAASATTAAAPDTTAPTVPTNLTATAVSTTQINLAWSASTDNVGVTGYRVYRSGTQMATATSTSYAMTGLSPATIYSFTVAAYDAAGNVSAQSNIASTNTFSLSDATPPTIALTAPTNGATVSGTITVSATASDNVGVVGVQFKMDGNNLGAEATAAPYTISWNTTTAANGAHVLTATARDAAGNTTTSSVVNVMVSNTAGTAQLIHQSDLTYVGAFKLPGGKFGTLQDTFDYGGGFVGGNVYNDPVNGKSLFIPGFLSALQISNQVSIAQVTIPSVIKDPNVVGVSGLTTATVVQGFADPSHGIGSQILIGNGFGTIIAYGGKLIGTEVVAYDATCSQSKSAWVAPINFAQSSQASGPYGFSESVTPRIIGGGFMAMIPPEWRSALGGAVVSGNGPTSIISCSTPGPSLHVIDADTLLTQPSASTPIAATPLVYYQDGIHSTLGVWNSNSPTQMVNGKSIPSLTVIDPHGRGTFTIAYEDNSMRIQGALFPDGTRSVLFFGHKGLGPYCYGTGGAGGGDCYDPDNSGKGDHAYPYTQFVWAYDVNDLLAVKNGQKQPWDVIPYTGWAFKVYGDGDGGNPVGIAWDPATRLAYMVVAFTNGVAPLVHVFSVGTP
jgi:chitodextrinase